MTRNEQTGTGSRYSMACMFPSSSCRYITVYACSAAFSPWCLLTLWPCFCHVSELKASRPTHTTIACDPVWEKVRTFFWLASNDPTLVLGQAWVNGSLPSSFFSDWLTRFDPSRLASAQRLSASPG